MRWIIAHERSGGNHGKIWPSGVHNVPWRGNLAGASPALPDTFRKAGEATWEGAEAEKRAGRGEKAVSQLGEHERGRRKSGRSLAHKGVSVHNESRILKRSFLV